MINDHPLHNFDKLQNLLAYYIHPDCYLRIFTRTTQRIIFTLPNKQQKRILLIVN